LIRWEDGCKIKIRDFNEYEKGVHTMDTLGGNQQNPKKMIYILWIASDDNEKFCFPLKEEANNNPINKGCNLRLYPLSNYEKGVF